MLTFRAIALVIVYAVLASGWALAASADSVKDQLDKAKALRTDDRAKARTTLIQAFDAQIKTAGSAGDLDTLKVLTTQKDGFLTAGILPNIPALKEPVAQYVQSLRKADGALVAAYETAIEAYTSESKADEAAVVRNERRALLDGTAESSSPGSPEAVGLVLDRARSDYQQTVGDAKNAFLQAIDARINTATNAGDLKAVTKLEAARAAADSDAPLPEGFNDVTVLSAKNHYGLMVLAANQKLANAYREAVRNYTRARAIDKAEAVQAELDAIGLSAAPSAGTGSGAAPSTDASYKLTRSIPSFLEATGAFSAEKGGIRPARGAIIATRSTDFLSKDFVFDVYVQVPKEDEAVTVGIGDTTEKGSLRVVIRDEGGWGRRAVLTHRDWGVNMGDIHTPELYVVRFERHGGPITSSVGSISDGKFTPDMSQTVSDVKAMLPGVSEKRAQLFFSGSAVFSEVRLAIGPSAPTWGGGGEAHSPGSPVKFPAAGASGQAPTPARNDTAEGEYRLNSDKLPVSFTATATYSVSSAGIKPYGNCLIITKAKDFLSKDFVFEAHVDVPRKEDWIIMGLGDGTQNGSLRLIIRPDPGSPARAFLTQGDEWGEAIGDIHEAGERVMQIKRHGTAVTVSVGGDREGKFEPEMSQTIADPKAVIAGLSERRAHLFFIGKTVWSRIRLVAGVAGGAPAAGVAPPDGRAGTGGTSIPDRRPALGGGEAVSPDGVFRLNSDTLPAEFSVNGTYGVSRAGIKPYNTNSLVITKAEDFLSKDFVFEAHVDVPRKEDWIIMGLGDGTQNGSLRLIIRPDGRWGTRAFLTLGDEWGKAIGDIREAGPRVLQITRHGTAVTVSVGIEKEGKFASEMSQTSADAKVAVAGLSERRAHLFFTGRTVWSEIRLVSGAAADTPVAEPVVPAAGTGVPTTMPTAAAVATAPASRPEVATADKGASGGIFSENGNHGAHQPVKSPGSEAFPAAPVGEVQRFMHNGPANAVLFIPDGQHAISAGGSDDVIRMWDIASGKEVRSFHGHSNKVVKLSISADGKTLASGSYDGTARTWNVETGGQTAMFKHGREVSAVALSSDARYLIVGDFGGNPVMYDLTNGTKLSEFHSEGRYAAAFSVSGRYAATGGWNHVNHVWDTRGGLREVLKTTQPGQVYAEAFTFDETRLISAGSDKAVHVWDLASGRELLTCAGHTGTIKGIACCPGDCMLVSGAEDGTVRVWSPQTGKEITEFSGGEGKVFGVAVSPDGHLAASAGEDGTVRIWKLPDPTAAPVPPTVAATSGPATIPASPPLASLRFAEGVGYTVAELREGTSTHNNEDHPLTNIPPLMAGKPFTQIVGSKKGGTNWEFATSGKIFILAQVWHGYPAQAATLENFAKKEPMQVLAGNSTCDVWSMTAEAGKRITVPFPVMLVADHLEKVRKLQ